MRLLPKSPKAPKVVKVTPVAAPEPISAAPRARQATEYEEIDCGDGGVMRVEPGHWVVPQDGNLPKVMPHELFVAEFPRLVPSMAKNA